MRTPTPSDIAYRWHREALADRALGLKVTITDEPQPGWFQRKLTRGGVLVPAKIWLYGPTDDNGELTGDEVLQCEVAGNYADPDEQWTWLASNPIAEQEFDYMMARRNWSAWYEPSSPHANPGKPVDWLRAPIPEF